MIEKYLEVQYLKDCYYLQAAYVEIRRCFGKTTLVLDAIQSH